MAAIYNDTERFACDWLQHLMDAGQIMPGKIDDRSIADLSPDDLAGYERVHLFAGVGGWDLALQLARWREGPVWTCSCPCPPFSQAGKRQSCQRCAGANLVWCPRRTGYCICADCGHAWLADGRHLWPEAWRLIARCRPARVFGEQVASPDGLEWLAGVRASLEIISYAPWGTDYPAAGVGAPNIRQRIFWLADADGGLARHGHLQSSGQHGQQPQDSRALRLANTGCASLQREFGHREDERPNRALEGEGHQRERGWLHAGLGRAAGGVADTAEQGRGEQPGRDAGADGRPASESGRLRDFGGMADRSGDGRRKERPHDGGIAAGDRSKGRSAGSLPGSEPDRLVDAEHPRLERHSGYGHNSGEPGWLEAKSGRSAAAASAAGFWSEFDIVHCTDGKARRIPQSPLQRLADGLPDGLVRGGFAGAEGFPLAEGAGNRVGRLRGYGNAINPYAAARFIRAWREVRAP